MVAVGKRLAVSLFLLAAGAALGAPVAYGQTCLDHRATIIGTSGSDVLVGTAGRDVIFAGAGRDIVRSLGGRDLVCGGPASDDIVLGPRGANSRQRADGSRRTALVAVDGAGRPSPRVILSAQAPRLTVS
jgi:Ca2+-binding RTX toxin-like protein